MRALFNRRALFDRRPLPTTCFIRSMFFTCFIRSMFFTYSTWQAHRLALLTLEPSGKCISRVIGMSERRRDLARLRKQLHRSCKTADVRRKEARRHQQASIARETEQSRCDCNMYVTEATIREYDGHRFFLQK